MATTSEPDYYRILDVASSATADQIKTAYREAAKRVHPDTGGTSAAMERLNAAYAVLSDSLARREYDRARALERRAYAPASTTSPAKTAPHPNPSPVHEPNMAAAKADAARRYRQAIRAVRFSTLPWLRLNGLLAILLGITTAFLDHFTKSLSVKIFLALLAFVPVYGFAMGVTFLIKPRLRIALGLIGRRGRHIPQNERIGLVALALAALPLALIWVVLFNIGLIR